MFKKMNDKNRKRLHRKGKGAPDHWAAVIKPGMILFEVGGVDINLAHRALELAADKLPVITKIAVKPTRD